MEEATITIKVSEQSIEIAGSTTDKEIFLAGVAMLVEAKKQFGIEPETITRGAMEYLQMVKDRPEGGKTDGKMDDGRPQQNR